MSDPLLPDCPTVSDQSAADSLIDQLYSLAKSTARVASDVKFSLYDDIMILALCKRIPKAKYKKRELFNRKFNFTSKLTVANLELMVQRMPFFENPRLVHCELSGSDLKFVYHYHPKVEQHPTTSQQCHSGQPAQVRLVWGQKSVIIQRQYFDSGRFEAEWQAGGFRQPDERAAVVNIVEAVVVSKGSVLTSEFAQVLEADKCDQRYREQVVFRREDKDYLRRQSALDWYGLL